MCPPGRRVLFVGPPSAEERERVEGKGCLCTLGWRQLLLSVRPAGPELDSVARPAREVYVESGPLEDVKLQTRF